MGRTNRKRKRKNKRPPCISLDNDPSYINLRKWMTEHGWRNDSSLKLTHFPDTGRGLSSNKKLNELDKLILVPYKLMITYSTIKDSSIKELVCPGSRLQMHDLLAIFLAIERHRCNSSKYRCYIETLPKELPPLPWLCSPETIECLPSFLRKSVKDRLATFESSWSRVEKSINPAWTCQCCDLRANRVLTLNLFTWAYVMVNTRAVYVEPHVVLELSDTDANLGLSDDPSMALCPYLDMFNHSSDAATQAGLVQIEGEWFFQLATLKTIARHQEVFISYGNHDNLMLLCEYGFYLDPYKMDSVLQLDFEEVLQVTKATLDKTQYTFVREKGLDKGLGVSKTGPSYNLSALLFVITSSHIPNWRKMVFTSEYSDEDLSPVKQYIQSLLEMEFEKLSMAAINLKSKFPDEEYLLEYLETKKRYIQRLIVEPCVFTN